MARVGAYSKNFQSLNLLALKRQELNEISQDITLADGD